MTSPQTTERVLIYADITSEDATKLDILTRGTHIPRGILLANLVYLMTIQNTTTPPPPSDTPQQPTNNH